ncbi:MAG: lytic transglycosylase domain-containing protein [Alphaproteobacteria bacterium]
MAATKILAACMMLASQNYNVPPALLVGIYKAEGGKVGQQVENTNGSYDLGPMQINTIWLPELSKKWGVSEKKAHKMVRDDACTNVNVAAWILRGHIDETKNLAQALQHYHSRTPKYGTKYKKRVLDLMRKNGLLKEQR